MQNFKKNDKLMGHETNKMSPNKVWKTANATDKYSGEIMRYKSNVITSLFLNISRLLLVPSVIREGCFVVVYSE